MNGMNKKWMDILKSLPFDGGPSTTRWVVLNTSLVISAASFILAMCIGFVYVHSVDHHFDVALGALVFSAFTAMFAFATNALNNKHQLGNGNDASTSTPVTSAVTPTEPK